MKYPKIIEVIISFPFALFNITPPIYPSKIENGIESIIARNIPCKPIICQLVIRIKASCPPIAPKTIPKFNPIPATIGINNDIIKNKFLDILCIISRIK